MNGGAALISITSSGSFDKTESFLKRVQKLDIPGVLESCGQLGVNALSHATPIETGLAAQSWGFQVSASRGVYEIAWTNTDTENGFPVVIMLQYGHGTGTGGYVAGRDFINPTIRPIFDQIAERVWRVVSNA
jgi:hypothetical protein